MQIRRIGYGVKGFWRITDYAVRFLRMVTETAKHRAKILAFWRKHGEQVTLDAFPICRRTLYGWKRQRATGLGRMEALNPKSRAPQKKRERNWPIEIIRMIKIIRTEHPNLGKEKVHPELKEFCDRQKLPCPSIATIGRLIKDAPDGMRTEKRFPSCAGRRKMRKPTKRLHKPKGYKSRRSLECVGLDSIEKQAYGSRRYIVTFIDLFSRFAFAFGTQSHASRETSRMMGALLEALPRKVGKALTDNGSDPFPHMFDRVIANPTTYANGPQCFDVLMAPRTFMKHSCFLCSHTRPSARRRSITSDSSPLRTDLGVENFVINQSHSMLEKETVT